MYDPSCHPNAPTRVERLLAEARRRTRAHIERQRGHGRGFVASDYASVHVALERIATEDLARGNLFCEWGSGFGVITMLASMLGFEAYGIEAQRDLVTEAEELAAEFGCDAHFTHGSFVGAGDDDIMGTARNPWWHFAQHSAYAEMGLDPEDFDVFYAYPWPGEEDLFDALFTRYAGVGALFLTHHDTEGVLVQCKVAPEAPLKVIGWY